MAQGRARSRRGSSARTPSCWRPVSLGLPPTSPHCASAGQSRPVPPLVTALWTPRLHPVGSDLVPSLPSLSCCNDTERQSPRSVGAAASPRWLQRAQTRPAGGRRGVRLSVTRAVRQPQPLPAALRLRRGYRRGGAGTGGDSYFLKDADKGGRVLQRNPSAQRVRRALGQTAGEVRGRG